MKRFTLFIFILSTFVVGTAELIIAGLLEVISADLHIKEAVVGQLITIYAISFAVGAPVLTHFTAKIERKKVLLSSLSVFIGGNILFASGDSFLFLAIVRAITAFSAAAFITVTLASAAKMADPGKQGKILGLVYMGFSAANVFGVPLGTYIGIMATWRAAFWMITLAAAGCFLLILFTIPSIKGHESTGLQAIRQTVQNPAIIGLLTTTTLLLAAQYVVYAYISPLMTGTGHSLEAVSFLLLIAGISGTIGSGIGGGLTDTFGTRRMLLSAIVIFIGGMLLMQTSLPYLWALALNVFIWNGVMWATNPAIQSALINVNPAGGELALSLNMSALNIGIGGGAMLGGTIVHYDLLYYAPFIAAAVSFIPLFYLKKILPREAEDQPVSQRTAP